MRQEGFTMPSPKGTVPEELVPVVAALLAKASNETKASEDDNQSESSREDDIKLDGAEGEAQQGLPRQQGHEYVKRKGSIYVYRAGVADQEHEDQETDEPGDMGAPQTTRGHLPR